MTHPLLTPAHRLEPADADDARVGWGGDVGEWRWEVEADIDATGSLKGTWSATAILVGSPAGGPGVGSIEGARAPEQAASALVALVPELGDAPESRPTLTQRIDARVKRGHPQNSFRVTAEQLVERAVRRATVRFGEGLRWVAVRDLFAVGSTAGAALVAEFGLDPDEEVGGQLVDSEGDCLLCGQWFGDEGGAA